MVPLCSRCGGGGIGDQPRTCTLVEGGPCEACKESAAIYHQIIQLEEEITKLKEKRRVLATTINENHDPFIHKLPSEVGSHIFHLCMPPLELPSFDPESQISYPLKGSGWGTPLTLGAVCRKWRQLAWATPNLWVAPVVDIGPATPSPLVESLPGLLREWLDRSGLLPFTIFFGHTRFLKGFTSNILANQETFKATTDLVIELINHYWGRLENLYLELEADLFECIAGSMEPNKITTLVLRVRNRSQIPQFITQSKPSPIYLTLFSFPPTSIDIGWDNVTHAALGRVNCKDIIKLLQRAPALEYCHISNLDGRWDESSINFDTVTLHPRLRSLTSGFHIENVLDVINVPSLEKWTHTDYTTPERHCYAMISLIDRSNCILKVLNLGGWFPIGLKDLLRATPSLEHLTLRFTWRFENTASMDDILTCMTSGGGATSELFLPHLLYFECGGDTSDTFSAVIDDSVSPFTWDRIPQLYYQDHRRSLTLKAWTHQSRISDETALELLQLVDEGVDLRILDWETNEDFLEKFRNSKMERVVSSPNS